MQAVYSVNERKGCGASVVSVRIEAGNKTKKHAHAVWQMSIMSGRSCLQVNAWPRERAQCLAQLFQRKRAPDIPLCMVLHRVGPVAYH